MNLTDMQTAFDAKTEEITRIASKGSDVSPAEYERAKSLYAEAKELQGQIAKAEARKAISDKFHSITGPDSGSDSYTGRKGVGPLGFKQHDLQELHNAAMSGSYARKTIDTGDSPMSTVPGYSTSVLPLLRDKARISDLIPSQQTSRPSEFYFRALTGATAAAPVAEGANKPESSPTYESVQVPVVKIAHYTRANDEVIADFGGFMDMISTELIAGLIDAENDQVLNGTGTPPEMQGILTATGIQTQARGTDSNLDALLKAATDLRTGSSYTEPDAVVIHPTNFQTIRLSKDDQGNYLLGNPLSSDPARLGGARFVVTNRIAAGTALVANFGESTKLFVREAPRVEVNPMGGAAEFIANQTLIRCEERLGGVAILRPTGIVKVTGLN